MCNLYKRKYLWAVLREKRGAAFRELRSDTKNRPCEAGELIQRLNGYAIGGFVQRSCG
jgi:hypothetical protein